MSEQVWTAEEVAEISAEALRLAEELRPVWPDEPSGGHTSHRYDQTYTNRDTKRQRDERDT